MIIVMKRCPFCDKEFFSSDTCDPDARPDMREKLRLHVIEHHHITEKKYYDIRKALELKYSLDTICNDMKDEIREFAERFETLQRNEKLDFL